MCGYCTWQITHFVSFIYYLNVIVTGSRESDWSAVPGTSAYLGREATVTREQFMRVNSSNTISRLR